MKFNKITATLFLTVATVQVQAQDGVSMEVGVNPNQETIQYAKAQTGTLDIYTEEAKQFWAFQTQYLLTGNDFNNMAQDGAILPAGAKVVRVGVKGYNNGGPNAITTLKTQAWMQSVENSYELNYKKGYKSYPNPTDPNLLYTNGVVVNTFSPNSTSANPDLVSDLPFTKPYIYDGKAVLVTLFQWYDGDTPMNFSLQTTGCEKSVGNVFRTGNHALSSKGKYYLGFIKVGAGTSPNIVPAFILDYYTNDITGTVTGGENVLVKLYDTTAQQYMLCDGQTAFGEEQFCNVNADGTFKFTNLDHSHIYTLTVGNATAGFAEKTLTFDGEGNSTPSADAVKNDVIVNVTM